MHPDPNYFRRIARPVIARIDDLLKPLGFIREKATWNRRIESFVDVINVQTNKVGDEITINAGVLHSETYKECWQTEPAVIVEEFLCTVRARVGQLLDGRDLWWRLNDVKAVDEIGEKVALKLLPFLEGMHSLQAMDQFLTAAHVTRGHYPLPVIYLAILKSELGDRKAACALLTELSKKAVGAWETRIAEVAERLGCN